MGQVTITEYREISSDYGNGVPIPIAPTAGLGVRQVTTSASSAERDIAPETRYVEIHVEDGPVRVDVGVGVAADAGSLRLESTERKSWAVPKAGYRVSLIDA